jgi:hypothetical protein
LKRSPVTLTTLDRGAASWTVMSIETNRPGTMPLEEYEPPLAGFANPGPVHVTTAERDGTLIVPRERTAVGTPPCYDCGNGSSSGL